jgi:hypothetical protein
MADYYGSSRTNTFRVKNPQEFLDWTEQFEVNVHQRGPDSFSLFPETEYGCFPSYIYTEDGEYEDLDFFGELSQFLVDDDVVIMMEAGAEKLRYIVGVAQAVNSKGEFLTVSIDDIYELVKEKWGIEPDSCEY